MKPSEAGTSGIELPAPPLGRAVGATIIEFFCVALAWSFFAQGDIIATAPGKVAPFGNVELGPPLGTGVVSAIHVADGDHVVTHVGRAVEIKVETFTSTRLQRMYESYGLSKNLSDLAPPARKLRG